MGKGLYDLKSRLLGQSLQHHKYITKQLEVKDGFDFQDYLLLKLGMLLKVVLVVVELYRFIREKVARFIVGNFLVLKLKVMHSS